MITAVVGINWGDEGKGRMVDMLGRGYDIVARCQGGNNAGHTVINDRGKFVLNLLPSGVLRDNTVNVMGGGMVVDLEHLAGELASLREKGIALGPDKLKISSRACICFPFHKRLDILEEERLGDKKFGSTRRGIAPAYADKYMKKSLRLGDLLFPDALRDRLRDIIEWKNMTVSGAYGAEPVSLEDTLSWLKTFGGPLVPFICDTGVYLSDAAKSGKNIMFEAQLGALRDVDIGIYPYTTSSNTLASYSPIGAGAPELKIDNVIGITKAYSTCVGEGPFTAELFGAEADKLRAAGAEYGAATGRPRRVGGFDVVASRYGARVQGADSLALTKLDVLACLERIPVCVAYDINGKTVTDFPGDIGGQLAAKPVVEYLDGFGASAEELSLCRKPADLPAKAAEYVRFIEDALGREIRYVSVGPSREDYITRD